MTCGKCNVKMGCKESYCWNNETYRRYQCPICGVKMYTQELKCSSQLCNSKLAHKWAMNQRKKSHKNYCNQ